MSPGRPEPDRAPPRAPRRLLLVRHAATAWNEAGRYQGGSDPDLSETGFRAARLLGEVLGADLRAGDGPIWCSDLRRATETARQAFPGEPLRLDARLRELSFGVFEGRTHEENLERTPEAYRRWMADPKLHPPPGGESLEAFRRRVREWLEEAAVEARRRTATAVTHGGVVRMVVTLLRGVGFMDALDPLGPFPAPGPGQGLLLERRGDGWRAVPVGPPGVAPEDGRRGSAADPADRACHLEREERR